MNGTVTIRNTVIGEGIPKIVVPIVGANREEILQKGDLISQTSVHLVEWRADTLEGSFSVEQILSILNDLREILGNKILLFTFRTVNEGGKKEISLKQYQSLNLSVALSGKADLIDIEVLSCGSSVSSQIRQIKDTGCHIVGSSHDFQKTPSKDQLIHMLTAIQTFDVDIMKIAVMPQNVNDLLVLLEATMEMSTIYARKPLATMAMDQLGLLSRLTGELFGSALTFGSLGDASAPGQIPVYELTKALNLFHAATRLASDVKELR